MPSLFRPCLKVIIASLAANCGSDALLAPPSPGAGKANATKIRGPAGIPGTCTCYTRSKAPKLTIFSVTVGLKAQYVESLRENRAIVADAYDYEYCEFSSNTVESRAPAWMKIRAIQILLERGRRRIAAMDADAFFVVKKPFEDVRTKEGLSIFELGKDVILTDDHPKGDRCNINTGVMVMNNSQWTKDFWQGVWDLDGPETDKMGLQDQSGVCLWRQGNREDWGEHVRVIGHALMNSIGTTKGEFIAHMAGGGSAGGHEEKYDKLQPFVEAANEQMRGTVGSDEQRAKAMSMPAEKFHVMY